MNVKNFRVAMLNNLRIGPYDTPHITNPPTQEWLIVKRGGADNLLLFISDTSTRVEPGETEAPSTLLEQNTIVATLIEDDGNVPQFLMMRHLPEGIPLLGRFFPADGASTLSVEDSGLRLRAFGRHAHSHGQRGDQSILYDIPCPAPGADGAINWHFDAERRPWIAETPFP